MANIFLEANDTFTQANSNTGDSIFGGTGSESVILQGNPDGTLLDGNVEEVQVAGNAADTTLQINAEGQLELSSGGTVYATFTGGLNAPVDLQFEDGNVTLTQTGANSYTIEDPADDTDSVTIDGTNSQTGDSVALGTETSTAGDGDTGGGDTGGDGETFTLTDGGLFEGTSGDDLFIGSPGQIDNAVIQAAGGTDQLNLTVTNADDNNGIVNSSDLENAYVRVSAGPVTLDFADADGIQQIWNDRSNGDFTIEGVTTDVTIGVRRTDADTTATFEGVSGSADEASIALDEVETGSQVTINDVETFNVETFGTDESDVTLLGDAVETVNVSGSADADIGAMEGTVATVDATGFENALTVDVGSGDNAANANDVTLTGGSGNDEVTAGANFDGDDTFDGGDGEDTFITSIAGIGANDTEFDGVSNFETARLTSAGTFSATPLAGFDTIEFAGGDTDTLDFDDVGADATVVLSDRNLDLTPAADALGAGHTITLDDPSGSDDTVNLDFLRTDADNETSTFNAGDVTADGVETINITSSGEDASDDDTVSITAQVDGDDATAVNISGDNELALTLGDVAGDEVTVDASAATNTVDVSISAGEAAGVTGGFTGGQADDDSLTITGIDADTVEVLATAFEIVGANFDDQATGELDLSGVSGVDTYNLTLNGTAADAGDAGAQTITVSRLSDGDTVNIDGSPGDNTNGGGAENVLLLEGGGASSSLTVALNSGNAFETVGGSDLTVDRAGTVTIDATDDADTAQTIGTLSLGTAEDLILNGGDSDVGINDITASDLETIDSTGLTDGSTLQLGDGAGAEVIANALEVTLGDHAFDIGLETGSLRDTVAFGGNDITDGDIRNFDEGLNGDVLDFSAFGDIGGLGDLTLTTAGGDVDIDSAAFDGTITLVGVVVGDLDSSNFDFA